VRRLHRAAADVQRRAHDPVRADPLEGEHDADDVDDRVEGADLVQVDLLDRHLMNRRFRLRQPLEQRPSRARGRWATSSIRRSA